jgi:hypothetical protein
MTTEEDQWTTSSRTTSRTWPCEAWHRRCAPAAPSARRSAACSPPSASTCSAARIARPVGPISRPSSRRDPQEGLRRRLVHGMVALEIVADPVRPSRGPGAGVRRVAGRRRHVSDGARLLEGAMDLARDDYIRNSYRWSTTPSTPATAACISRRRPPAGWIGLAARWQALGSAPPAPGPDGLGLLPDAAAYPGTRSGRLLLQLTRCTASPTTASAWARSVFSFIARAIPDPGACYLS